MSRDFMQEALELARRGLGQTSPNPAAKPFDRPIRVARHVVNQMPSAAPTSG